MEVFHIKKAPDSDGSQALYQQVVEYYARSIRDGSMPPGHRLPTVRDFAQKNKMALGTVKHAYDILAQMGYVEKTQGRGTFVRDIFREENLSRKDQAVSAIDDMLDKLASLGFTHDETRIFLDLKLREREDQSNPVRLAAVDCSPEALAVMGGQLAELPGAEVVDYLLQPVLQSDHVFRPDADIIVTTPTHFTELTQKTATDMHVVRLVMAISRHTLVQMARIPADAVVGILTASPRFAEVIDRTCERYGMLARRPNTALLGDENATAKVIAESSQLILPANYLQFCNAKTLELVQNATAQVPPILFDYRVEQGSLLALEEDVKRVRARTSQAFTVL